MSQSRAFLLFILLCAAASALSTDKQRYSEFETVRISIGEPADRLEIESMSRKYVVESPGDEGIFIPVERGLHSLYLFQGGEIIEESSFFVGDDLMSVPQMQEGVASWIESPGEGYTIRIACGSKGYELIPSGKRTMFIPLEEGRCTADMFREGTWLEQDHFIVTSGEPAADPADREPGSKDRTARIRLSGKDISLRGVRGDASKLRYADLDIQDIGGKKIARSYAIDPSGLDFDEGELRAVATGTELLKCKDYVFDTRTCVGTWEKVLDLIPGQEYIIPLSPADPAFAEAGVAAFNTGRPVYRPGEMAEILVFVLDTKGYLSDDAIIQMNITTPDGDISSHEDLTRIGRGTYRLYYETLGEGTYHVSMHASAADVDQSFVSFFEVSSSIPYDIIREAPLALDPWQSLLHVRARIYSADSGPFSFTEILPPGIEVEDDGGADVREEDSRTTLTWHGLENSSSISYSASVPKIAPALYQLGPALIDDGEYIEARPWYFAADPDYNFTYLAAGKLVFGYPQTNGTMTGVFYDTVRRAIELNASTGSFESIVFDTGAISTWNNISLAQEICYRCNLPAPGAGEAGFSQPADTSGATLLLHMDDQSGGLIDSSGQSNHAAAPGALSYGQSALFNHSVAFSGAATSYARIPDSATLDSTDRMTISFWMNPSLVDGSARAILSKRMGINTQTSYSIFLYTGSRLFVDLVNNDNRFSTHAAFSPNRWYHVAIVYDGTLASAQRAKVYVNGTLDITASETAASIPDTVSNLTIGILNENYATRYAGSLDEIMIIKGRALSSEEVSQLYRRGLSAPNVSIRSCDDPSCSGESYQALPIPPNRYVQYRIGLDRGDWLVPQRIHNVTIGFNVTGETTGPVITDVSDNQLTGPGQWINLTATVTDINGLDDVHINITSPSGRNWLETMITAGQDIFSFLFRPWEIGSYYFAILANDTFGVETILDPYFFVEGNASLSLKTEHPSYDADTEVLLASDEAIWWDHSWRYRIPVTVSAGSANRSDYPVEYTINLSRYLTGIHNDSFRLIEWRDDSPVEVPLQVATFPATDWGTNAVVQLIWIMDEETLAGSDRTYHLYLDTEAKPAANYTSPVFNHTFNAGSTVIANEFLSVTLDDSGVIEDIRSRQGSSLDVTENWYWNYFRTTDHWDDQSFTATIRSRSCGPVRCSIFVDGITSLTDVSQANTTYHVYRGSREIRSYKGFRMSASEGMQIGDDLNIASGNFLVTGSYPGYTETDTMDGTGASERTDRSSAHDRESGYLAYRVVGAPTDAFAVVRKFARNASGAGVNVSMHPNWYDGTEHSTGWENGYSGSSDFLANQDYLVANFYYVTTAEDADYSYALQFYASVMEDAHVQEGQLQESTSYSSVIQNTGSTDISGYLLMQLLENRTGSPVLVDTIVDDLSSSQLSSIPSGSALQLSGSWNPVPWDTAGSSAGSYLIYAALLDDVGEVLQSSSGVPLNHTYPFLVNNTLPVASQVVLNPEAPSLTTPLQCQFIITDRNPDILTARVNWYKDGMINQTQEVDVDDGIVVTAELGTGNLTVGEAWICEVLPYDSIDWGTAVNSSARTILASRPPEIQSIECEEDSTVWASCDNIGFSDVISRVRVSCWDPDGTVRNATFSLGNLDDRITFFSGTTDDNATGQFMLDSPDIRINDSGTWNLSVTCTDEGGVSATNTSAWYVPWGTCSLQLISPASDYNATQDRFFTFSARISCLDGECGSFNATLDPPAPWDDLRYGYRHLITLSEPAGLARTSEHVRFNISLDPGILPLSQENRTVFYCNGTRVRMDAYALETSGLSITRLEALAELDFLASGSKECFLYHDPDFGELELLPVSTGWGYACDNAYSGTCGTSGDITLANMDMSGVYADLSFPAISCGADQDTFYHNMWCYFQAPDSGVQVLATASDDGSEIRVEGTQVVNNHFCQGTTCRSGTYTFEKGRYYRMRAEYDENTGGNEMHAYYNPTSCSGASGDAGAGNSIGDECYPFLGDEFTINVAVGGMEGPKAIIPVETSQPFYTTDSNPHTPSDLACLSNMSAGDICISEWSVNSTGAEGSVHEFFMLLTPIDYPGLGTTESSHINITIIPDRSPFIHNITLLPAFPVPDDDLVCEFAAGDDNGDELDVELTWYRNGIIYSIASITASPGVAQAAIMPSANTSLAETWRCGARPMDQSLSGPQVNSSIVSILSNRPPAISLIQCQENSTAWGSCSGIGYLDRITAVRANCTDVDGEPAEVVFNLTNIPDNRTLLDMSTPDDSTEYFVLDNPDVLVNDSGYFNLTATCIDNNASMTVSSVLWNVPWGTFSSALVDPVANTNVEKNEYFDFTTLFSCSGGECGSINASLDPDAWDAPDFRYRSDVRIVESRGLQRNDTHVLVSFSIPEQRLMHENGTIMYCAGRQVPWDGYARSSSGSWITGLEGIAEINISASSSLDCHIYMDPSHNGTELLPHTTGWDYVGATGISGGNVVDLTPSQVTCYVRDPDGEIPSGAGVCGAVENIKLNEWCYFKSPLSASIYFKTGSDDGSILYHNGSVNVYNDGAHGVTWQDNVCASCGGSLALQRDRYYPLEIGFAENTGGESLFNRWATAAGDDSSGNVIDAECYPYYGDEWQLSVTAYQPIERFKGILPVGSGYPFYVLEPNARQPSDLSCLMDMRSGDTCQVSWTVNATGTYGTSHIFYSIATPLSYPGFVSEKNSTKINITIADANMVPPSVTLSSPQSNFATIQGTVEFNCSATDNQGLENITLYANFSGSFLPNSSASLSGLSGSASFPVQLPEGIFTWNCLAYDDDGNHASAANRTVIVDRHPAYFSLQQPYQGQGFHSSTVQVNYTVIDNIDRSLLCNVTVDSTVQQSIVTPNNTLIQRTFSSMSVGTHSYNISCVDDAGNRNTSSTTSFEILDLYPGVVLMTQDNMRFTTNDISLVFNATDNLGISEASLYIGSSLNQTRSGIVLSANETFNLTIAEGRYRWSVTVNDSSGLTNTTAQRTFFVDMTPPTISITAPADHYISGTPSVAINFTPYDNVATSVTCNITVNGTVVHPDFNVNNATYTSRVTSFPDGTSEWNITCRDPAGNSATTLSRLMNVSAIPQVTLVSPASGYSQTAKDITLTYHAADNTGFTKCELLVDGRINKSNATITNNANSVFYLEVPQERSYEWSVNCTDTTGLFTQSASRAFTVDSTPMSIVLHSPPNGTSILGSTQYFNFTVSDVLDPVMTCNLSVDNVRTGNLDFSAPDGTVIERSFTVSGEGNHYWYVECRDDAGNYNKSLEWLFISSGAPTVTAVSPDSGTIRNQSAIDLVYMPHDSGTLANTTLSLGGILNQTDTTPENGVENTFSLSQLADGLYSWHINATDTDSLSASTEERTFTIDTTYPKIIAAAPQQGQVISTNELQLNFSALDNIAASMVCSVRTEGHDIALSAPNNTARSVAVNLTDGSYNWTVACRDTANNTNTTQPVFFTVEAPPSVALLAPQDNSRNRTSSVLLTYRPYDTYNLSSCTLVFDSEDNQSTSAPLNGQANSFLMEGLSEGEHNWTVRCLDSDANTYAPPVRRLTHDTIGPSVTLGYPGAGATVSEGTVIFNYTPSDTYPVLLSCYLTVSDATDIQRTSSGMSGSVHQATVSGLSDGVHDWNVTCADDLGNIGPSSSRTLTVATAPVIALISPSAGNWTNIPSPAFFFNASDNTGIGNCSLLIDGTPDSTSDDIWTSGISNLTATSLGGHHVWEISCYDTSGNLGISQPRDIYVDLAQPEPVILTQDSSSHASSTPTISFNITDNMDTLLDYRFYADGTINREGTAASSTIVAASLLALGDGEHEIILEAADSAGNRKNSTVVSIYVDTVAPSIILSSPDDGAALSDGTAVLNFTAIDQSSMLCNITLDDSAEEIDLPVLSGVPVTASVEVLTSQVHHWNVTCIDNAGNRNTSLTWDFTIPLPDIYVISMSLPSTASEGSNISVNATIGNSGESSATDLIVQFFHGNYSEGRQIQNFTISLLPHENMTLNTSFIAGIPNTYEIFVICDPDIETGGSIPEIDEADNWESASVIVGSYNTIYGDLAGSLLIKDNTSTVYSWSSENLTGTNIFAADQDSIISWGDLVALGRTALGAESFADFRQLDEAMMIENNSDSINNSYTASGSIKEQKTYVVFGSLIASVPVVNSTNTSQFQTGILWDSADGEEFDGTQDVVFVTEAAHGQGMLGEYDFEFRIPSGLRDYKGPDTVAVALYTELR